jgi:hypothetical protein
MAQFDISHPGGRISVRMGVRTGQFPNTIRFSHDNRKDSLNMSKGNNTDLVVRDV